MPGISFILPIGGMDLFGCLGEEAFMPGMSVMVPMPAVPAWILAGFFEPAFGWLIPGIFSIPGISFMDFCLAGRLISMPAGMGCALFAAGRFMPGISVMAFLRAAA